jgi:hypothetical protein
MPALVRIMAATARTQFPWQEPVERDPAGGCPDRCVRESLRKGASEADRHAGYTYVECYLNELADAMVAAEAEACTIEVAVQGTGLGVCEHGGRTRNWRIDPDRRDAMWRERAGRASATTAIAFQSSKAR